MDLIQVVAREIKGAVELTVEVTGVATVTIFKETAMSTVMRIHIILKANPISTVWGKITSRIMDKAKTIHRKVEVKDEA